MELLSHNEDNEWIIKLDATETAQLYINGAPYGSAYTVGADRETILSLRTEETDVVAP